MVFCSINLFLNNLMGCCVAIYRKTDCFFIQFSYLPNLLIGGSMAFLQGDAATQMLKTNFMSNSLEDMKLFLRCLGPPKLNSVCDPVNY